MSLTYTKTCIICGNLFEAKKSYSKYCSEPCKRKVRNRRRSLSVDLLKLYKKEFLKAETLKLMNSWNKVPKQDKEVLLNMGTQDEAFGTLKELGYPESLALKPIAFSEDGKLLVTVNLIRQFRIEYIKT